jgi:hypothetical protein
MPSNWFKKLSCGILTIICAVNKMPLSNARNQAVLANTSPNVVLHGMVLTVCG